MSLLLLFQTSGGGGGVTGVLDATEAPDTAYILCAVTGSSAGIPGESYPSGASDIVPRKPHTKGFFRVTELPDTASMRGFIQITGVIFVTEAGQDRASMSLIGDMTPVYQRRAANYLILGI